MSSNMAEILEKMENRIENIYQKFKNIKEIENNKIEVLKSLEDFNKKLDNLELSLLDLQTNIFQDNLELLDYQLQKDIINHKIDKAVEKFLYPYMILIRLNLTNNINII